VESSPVQAANGSGPALPPSGLVAAATVSDMLNEAPRSGFHNRAVVISGMGFFTDAYDLFVIGTVCGLREDPVAPVDDPDELGGRRDHSRCLHRRFRVRTHR
jgi:hypothetical protein